jgi:hypothetical protein
MSNLVRGSTAPREASFSLTSSRPFPSTLRRRSGRRNPFAWCGCSSSSARAVTSNPGVRSPASRSDAVRTARVRPCVARSRRSVAGESRRAARGPSMREAPVSMIASIGSASVPPDMTRVRRRAVACSWPPAGPRSEPRSSSCRRVFVAPVGPPPARAWRPLYFCFFRSRTIASSASMISSRVARLLLKLSLRLNALVGGRKAKT